MIDRVEDRIYRSRMRLKKTAEELVARERVCRVATVGAAQVPHVVPVCHVLSDVKVCFGSDADAKKIEHLRGNPHVAVMWSIPEHLFSWDLD